MKTAKFNPLHKGKTVFLVANYRSISLLPIFSKIFERLVFNHLTEFTDKHKILTQNQFGFQKNKSTELAVASICHKLLSFLNVKNQLTVSFSTLQKFLTL